MKKKVLLIILVILVMIFFVSVFLYKKGIFKITNNDHLNEIDDKKEEIKSKEQDKTVKDLFGEFYSKAEEKLNEMSIEDKVGQMFLSRCPSDGTEITEITNLNPGGYVLFGRDFKDKTKLEVINKIKSYQNASKIPMLIAVDEEGDSVVRVSSNRNLSSYTFKSPQEVYKSGGYEAIRKDATEKCDLLLSLGINLNLAPVCDVSTNPNDYMYYRSFGSDANKTAEFVKNVIEVCNSKGMGSTLKHFPGYGSNTDTHSDISIDKKTKEQYENVDLIPFKEGIKNGAQSILVSHNIVQCYDNTLPSSLSKPVHELLRNTLGFTGIIITDDLSMKGITNYTDGKNAAILAVNAGNDILISSDLKNDKDAVINAVKNGDILEDTINLAVRRILAWKYSLNII